MDKGTTITLPEVLPYLNKDPSDKLTLFINPSGQLETFFNYKGKLIELHKEKLRIEMGKNPAEEIGEELRSLLIMSLHYGYNIVLHLGASENFDIEGFFSQFSWYKKDFFLKANFLKTDYLKKNKLVKDDEDKDFFGNQGGYEVKDTARIFVLTHVEFTEVNTLLAKNAKLEFECVYVQ